jgi:hypothetical protein
VKRAPFEPGREWQTVNAIHRKELPMPEKSLLIAIAKHEARRDRVCYASVRTLSSDAGCDEKTGRRVIERLKTKYKLIRVRKVRGAASHIVIDSQRFKRFTETPPKSGRGTSRTKPLPKLGVPPLPDLGVPTPPKIGSRGVKNQGEEKISGAVRISGAKNIEGCRHRSVDNSVQPSISFKEVAAIKKHPAPSWVKGELAEDLFRGVHHQKIANSFFDARHLSPREQLLTCITVAVTSLATARVARLKVLNTDEVEARVFQELLGGLETLASVRDFEIRRQQTTRAVTRVLVEQCVRMLENQVVKA